MYVCTYILIPNPGEVWQWQLFNSSKIQLPLLRPSKHELIINVHLLFRSSARSKSLSPSSCYSYLLHYKLQSSGAVPLPMNTATVNSILKKPTLYSTDLGKYRHISSLPFLLKVLEKVVTFQFQADMYMYICGQKFTPKLNRKFLFTFHVTIHFLS